MNDEQFFLYTICFLSKFEYSSRQLMDAVMCDHHTVECGWSKSPNNPLLDKRRECTLELRLALAHGCDSLAGVKYVI